MTEYNEVCLDWEPKCLKEENCLYCNGINYANNDRHHFTRRKNINSVICCQDIHQVKVANVKTILYHLKIMKIKQNLKEYHKDNYDNL
jgi:hypothetical protein